MSLDIYQNLNMKVNSILNAVIDTATNTISNLTTSNLATGTLVTDLTAFSGTLHTSWASAKAVKDYVATLASGSSLDAGNWDASAGTLPTTGTGAAGAILKSNFWHISVAGTISGLSPAADLQVGDILYSSVAGATTSGQFFAVQGNAAAATATVLGLVMTCTAAEAELKASTKAVTAAVLTAFARKRTLTVTTDGVTTAYTVTHTLGKTLDQLIVTCRDTTTGSEFKPTVAAGTDASNQLLITCSPAYPSGGYTVNISGL
jgi:hypothetical protein